MATKTQSDHAPEKSTPVNAMLQYQDEEAAGEEDGEDVMTLIAILIHIDTDTITSGLLAITLQSDYQNQHV